MIEWDEDRFLEPVESSLEALCTQKGLPAELLPGSPLPAVFIDEKALESLNHYLEADLSREHGGVLAGLPFYDSGRGSYFVDIQAAIPAMETTGSPVHLQFTPQAWDTIAGILEENFPDLMIVGWYHSHPGLGVFMSATDQATHRAFYHRPWNVALVVDPAMRQSGWFAGLACARLGRGQVLLYGEQALGRAGRATEASEAAQAAERRRIFADLTWFLPLGLFALALLLSGLWLLRQRG
jgi:proteasome lid subunit RPN8/RPN11